MPLKDYLPEIISSLAGGAIGAGGARLITKQRPDESDEQYAKRLALNTGTGALSGAAIGAAAPMAGKVVDYVLPEKPGAPPSWWDRFKEEPLLTMADTTVNTATDSDYWPAIGGVATGGVMAARSHHNSGKEYAENLAKLKDEHLRIQDSISKATSAGAGVPADLYTRRDEITKTEIPALHASQKMPRKLRTAGKGGLGLILGGTSGAILDRIFGKVE